jgi:hypothetical protein
LRYIRQKSQSNGRGGRRISWNCHEISSRISGRPDPAPKFPSGSTVRIYVRIPWSLCDLALILQARRSLNFQHPARLRLQEFPERLSWVGRTVILLTLDGISAERRIFFADLERRLVVRAVVPLVHCFEAIPDLNSDTLWRSP